MASTTTTKQSAHDTYQHRRVAIQSKLVTINALLERHAAREARSDKNWGYAGDLAEVDILLGRIVEFLG